MKKDLLAIIVFFAIALCGCKNNSSQVIKIGAILPLSGNSSIIGEPKKKALEIASDEFNGLNGINIKFLIEDSKGSSKDAITAFQKLLNDKSIKYYYIDLTTVVNTCIPLVNKNKVISFAGSAEPEITEQSDFLFRLFAGGDQEIKLITDELKKENIENIFVLHTNELYGKNAYKYLKSEYLANGGHILGNEDYPMNSADFRTVLMKAKIANPQKIVLLGYGNEYAPLLKQAIELGIEPRNIICNLGGSNKSVIELPYNYIEELTFVGPRFSYLMMNNQLEPEMKKFVNSYKEKYNELPDFRAAYTYDVIKVLMSIWEKHKDDIDDVKKISSYLVDVKNFKGASGNISFKQNGDTQTDLIVAKYVNGKIILK